MLLARAQSHQSRPPQHVASRHARIRRNGFMTRIARHAIRLWMAYHRRKDQGRRLKPIAWKLFQAAAVVVDNRSRRDAMHKRPVTKSRKPQRMRHGGCSRRDHFADLDPASPEKRDQFHQPRVTLASHRRRRWIRIMDMPIVMMQAAKTHPSFLNLTDQLANFLEV